MLEMQDIDQMDTVKLVAVKGETAPALEVVSAPLPVVAPEEAPAPDPYVQWQQEALLCFYELCGYLNLPAFKVEHLEVMLRIVRGVAQGSYLHSPCRCWMRYHADTWQQVEVHEPECLYHQARQLVASLEGAA